VKQTVVLFPAKIVLTPEGHHLGIVIKSAESLVQFYLTGVTEESLAALSQFGYGITV
jgi:hypothetical protein